MIVKPCCIILSLESIWCIFFSNQVLKTQKIQHCNNNNACTVTQAVLKGAKKQFDLFGQAVACIY